MSTADAIYEKLQKRHQERLEAFEKRRQERRKNKDEDNETADAFLLSFNSEKKEIMKLFNNLDSVAKPDLPQQFDNLSQKTQLLQKYVSDSSMFLPSYDVRRAQEILNVIRGDIAAKRELLIPKKKFAFKSRAKASEKKTVESESQTKQVVAKSYTTTDFVGFSDKIEEVLTLDEKEASNQDISLMNLDGCNVTIRGAPSSMQIKNVINSEINVGPVSRSIFINDCADCTFQLACQQLRIHNSIATKFYIHVTSKAIIEDSEELGFGKFQWDYPNLDDDFDRAGLDRNVNNWEEVDDFNWLKIDEHSPNWYKID